MCKFIVERFPRLAGSPDRSLFERAKSALGAFDFCYFTHTFEASARAIISAMGYTADVKKENTATVDAVVEVDRDLIKNDLALYDWALDHFSAKSIDLNAPNPSAMRQFLSGRPDITALEQFIFYQQAYEFDFWNIVDEVAKEKVRKAEAMLREANYYLNYKRFY